MEHGNKLCDVLFRLHVISLVDDIEKSIRVAGKFKVFGRGGRQKGAYQMRPIAGNGVARKR